MTHSGKWRYEVDGKRGRNLAFNLLIKRHAGLIDPEGGNSQQTNNLESLARTENSLQVLEKFAIFWQRTATITATPRRTR